MINLYCYHVESGNVQNPDVIYLFGRAGDGTRCKITVNGLNRRIYVLPRNGCTDADVTRELQALCKKADIDQYSCRTVDRRNSSLLGIDNPEDSYLFVELCYSYGYPDIVGSSGQTFRCVFGFTMTSLETFIVSSKLKGPMWITIRNTTQIEPRHFEVNSPNMVVVDEQQGQPPPVVYVGVAFSSPPTTTIAMAVAARDHIGFTTESTSADEKSNGPPIIQCRDERDLWSKFSQELHNIDPDIVVTYAVSLNRRRRLECDGRLVCDIRTSADEFIGKGRTAFPELVCSQLKFIWTDIIFCDQLRHVEYHLGKARVLLRLVDSLRFIPLTIQLTKLCGNLLSQSFQGQRAIRVDYLLLHAFAKLKFMIPDCRESQKKPFKYASFSSSTLKSTQT